MFRFLSDYNCVFRKKGWTALTKPFTFWKWKQISKKKKWRSKLILKPILKETTHDLNHDSTFYCTHNQLQCLEYLGYITLNPDVRSFCYLNNFFSCISVSAESSISREAKRLVKKYAYAACKSSLKVLILFPWNVLLEIWFCIGSFSWVGAPAKIKNSYTVLETGAKYEFSKNFVASNFMRADLTWTFKAQKIISYDLRI